MNNEIVQSILSTYTVLRTYLQVLNSRRVVWLFAILREILNVWLYYVTFVWWLFHVLIRRCLSSSATPNDLGHRPVNHSAGPSAHQPVGDLFLSWLALSLAKQGCLSPSSTRASQPYMACKLTVPPWNGFLQQASVLKVVQKRSRVSPTIRGWVPPPQKFFFIWKWWVFVHSEWYFMWFRATRE